MARNTPFEVPIKVLLEQGRVTLQELTHQDLAHMETLERVGITPGVFCTELEGAIAQLKDALLLQDRAKKATSLHQRQDSLLARQGYQWVQRLHARARVYLDSHPQQREELVKRLRFRSLHGPRAQGVLKELRVLLPEVDALRTTLGETRLEAAHVVEGQRLLERLEKSLGETAAARKQQQSHTREVRKAAVKLSAVLARLRMGEQAAAVESSGNHSPLRLELIGAATAQRKSRRKVVLPEVKPAEAG